MGSYDKGKKIDSNKYHKDLQKLTKDELIDHAISLKDIVERQFVLLDALDQQLENKKPEIKAKAKTFFKKASHLCILAAAIMTPFLLLMQIIDIAIGWW